MKKETNTSITPFETDIVKWYSDVVLKGELISYGPVKGTMFYKPHGFSLWENISKLLDQEFKKLGVENVNFPLLFPEEFLAKEKEHVSGFAPEVLTVTRVGDKILNEPLIVRPTSETLFGVYFRDNLNSYTQLPLKLNQWVNVVRWENNTRPFLRNSEFHWQEGHTIHATDEQALAFSQKIHQLYWEFTNNVMLLPTIKGEKTESERFAGANRTFTIESILKDGQALQSGTSHFLGDSFAKAFNVKVQGKDNQMFHPFQTSWGVSTRLIGALIMTHSDNYGLIIPSKIAPVQIAILTLFAQKNPEVEKTALSLQRKLAAFRIKVDLEEKGIGFKSRNWELKGVPIRIEIGPKDVEQNQVVVVLRNGSEKQFINLDQIDEELINQLLTKHDDTIYQKAVAIRDEKATLITDLEMIQNVVTNGQYGYAYWTPNADLEQQIKEQTGASIRCLVEVDTPGECIHSKKQTTIKALFARAY